MTPEQARQRARQRAGELWEMVILGTGTKETQISAITAALLAVRGEALEEAVQIANQHEAWRVRDAIRALAHSSGAKPS